MSGTGPLAAYDTVVDITLEAGDVDQNGHLSNVGVARVLHEARSEWLLTLEGRPPGNIYVVRHLAISYEAEGFPEQTYRCGVRAASRGSRSLTLDATLVAGDTVIATSTATHVCFDTAARRPVELWPAVLASIEARQGPVPRTTR